MKILVLLPDSPDPWSNTAARYYGPMLKMLANLGNHVTVLGIRRGKNSREESSYFEGAGLDIRLFDQPRARRLVERKLRSLWRPGWEFLHSELGRAARVEAERNYDVILAEMPEAARVLEDDPRTVLSLHHFRFEDLSFVKLSGSAGEKFEMIQARRTELSTCRRVQRIRATSRRLEQLARAHGVTAPISVVPICLDPDLYVPVTPPSVPTVGVLGSMFWAPSRQAGRQFLERIVPRIRAQHRGVRFVVGGWQARRYLAAYVQGSDVQILDSFPNPAEAFAQLSVLVYAPPVGTGMKVKVLEAMAYGVPVVVNSEGFEGLDADPNPPVRLANSDEEITDHVLQLLRDPAARRRASEEGRRCIERSFSPQVVTQALTEVLQQQPRGMNA